MVMLCVLLQISKWTNDPSPICSSSCKCRVILSNIYYLLNHTSVFATCVAIPTRLLMPSYPIQFSYPVWNLHIFGGHIIKLELIIFCPNVMERLDADILVFHLESDLSDHLPIVYFRNYIEYIYMSFGEYCFHEICVHKEYIYNSPYHSVVKTFVGV